MKEEASVIGRSSIKIKLHEEKKSVKKIKLQGTKYYTESFTTARSVKFTLKNMRFSLDDRQNHNVT